MRSAPSVFMDMSRIVLPPSMWALSMAVAAGIGFISSIVPAWNAVRLSVVDALRFTD